MYNVSQQFRIEPATSADVPVILRLIRGLAEYERLSAEVVAKTTYRMTGDALATLAGGS